MAKASKQKKDLPVILITNDDGITAPGIRNLAEAVKDLGKIVIVAPDKPQSGMGHAITIGQPLRLHPVQFMDKVLHRKPHICLSGINHGANHSINVIYSGTMSAAVEAAIESIPSIGFSLLDYSP
jgi:5'-nucleotidase